MIEIQTARGIAILIDNDDEELVSGFSWWVSRGYALARWPGAGRNASRCVMHRLIMGAPKHFHVHHKNKNGLDNRKANLVLITPDNHKLEHPRGGVYFNKREGKFYAQVRIQKRRIFLGQYDDEARALRVVFLARELLPDLTDAEMLATTERIKYTAKMSTLHPCAATGGR